MAKELRKAFDDKEIVPCEAFEITPTNARIRIETENQLLVDTRSALKLSERRQAPIFFVPIAQIQSATLHCETENMNHPIGLANHFSVGLLHKIIRKAGWFFPGPDASSVCLRKHVAFYPDKFDCYIDGDLALPTRHDSAPRWRVTKPTSDADRCRDFVS